MGRAVIVPVMPEPEYERRQWGVLLEHCRRNGHSVLALTRSPEAAVALVVARHADLVVATVVDEDGVLESAVCPVVLLRKSRTTRPMRGDAVLIRSMLARGGDVETIAQLLGIDAERVEAAAIGLEFVPRQLGRRAQTSRTSRAATGAHR